MDLSTVRRGRRKSLFRPWNSYLAKKGVVEASTVARELDLQRAQAKRGQVDHFAPLVRLTVNLLDTYEVINADYYHKKPLTQPLRTPPDTFDSPRHSQQHSRQKLQRLRDHLHHSPQPEYEQQQNHHHLEAQQAHHLYGHMHESYQGNHLYQPRQDGYNNHVPHYQPLQQHPLPEQPPHVQESQCIQQNAQAFPKNTFNTEQSQPQSSHYSATNPQAVADGDSLHLIQYCDENSDYIVRTGELFNNRYILKKVIGRGSFGQVVHAIDTHDNNTHVAIKIIKNHSSYVDQALSEVRMTAYLNSIDPEDEHSIMRLRNKFIYRGHQCLVLELLSHSLYDLLRNTDFYGVNLNLVRKFCKQILKFLAFLARPDINIAHCDLKPENVLLRHPQRSIIKVVDFGASCRISDKMFVYVQSRFYRAPEVILGLQYGTQVDVWSLGCMLIELHAGFPVFAGKDEGDQIAIIVERLGLPPADMLERGKRTHLFFDRHSVTGAWSLKPSVSVDHGSSQPGSKPIRAFVDLHTGGKDGQRKRDSGGHSEEDYEIFLALAGRMLEYNPAERITAEDALKDPFVRGLTLSGRSGRDSPPPMPSGLSKVGEQVPKNVEPGRKAPFQRRRKGVGADGEASAADDGNGGGGTEESYERNATEAEWAGSGGEERTRDGVGESSSDIGDAMDGDGYRLKKSRSEPAGVDVIARRTHEAYPQSDPWFEDIGIEPPPWRSGAVIEMEGSEKDGTRFLDTRGKLGCAGKGGSVLRRRRMGEMNGGLSMSAGDGAGCGSSLQVICEGGYVAGCNASGGGAGGVCGSGGVGSGDVGCVGGGCGGGAVKLGEKARARDAFWFGIGENDLAKKARAAAVELGRSAGRGVGVTPMRPGGHGNALSLLTR